MLEYGPFVSHSGLTLPWKVDCDAFTDADWETCALIVKSKFIWSRVVGVPRGGLKFAEACRTHCVEGYPELVVDDVLTTGKSMEQWRSTIRPSHAIGVVVFARGPVPNWVWPIFTVSEWAQSRGTGIG